MAIATRGMNVSNRLREWRLAEDLTLDEVAGLVGLSVSMVSLVERGKRNLSPRAKVLFARRLGLPVRELFYVEELLEVG